MTNATNYYCVFPTANGYCGIACNGIGITRFQLPASTAAATERNMRRRLPNATPGEPPSAVAETIAAATRYFDGEMIDFSEVPLDLDGQDESFRQIYEAVRQIGWGRTTTYGALAKALGRDWEGARDVGQAMAKNPVPLIIPCHRVLAAGGKVGGFSAPGGSIAKQRMLELEGVQLAAPPVPTQQSLNL